jgi:hypothetical protein
LKANSIKLESSMPTLTPLMWCLCCPGHRRKVMAVTHIYLWWANNSYTYLILILLYVNSILLLNKLFTNKNQISTFSIYRNKAITCPWVQIMNTCNYIQKLSRYTFCNSLKNQMNIFPPIWNFIFAEHKNFFYLNKNHVVNFPWSESKTILKQVMVFTHWWVDSV